MTDAPPQLGQISQSSGFSVPTLQSNMDNNTTNGNIQNAKDTIYNSQYPTSSRDHQPTLLTQATDAQSAATTAQNHPVTQSIKDTVANGPVADMAKEQHAKTASEFSNLANSRTTPDKSAATGQPLTHYHSFFYNLLSWENPRATTLSFVSIILFIFAARYLPALRWSFKALYMVLGVTAAAEVAGKLVLSQGLTSSFRPKQYYTIPREFLEASLEDVEQLINFFVIEFQRVLFAENVTVTIACFLASVMSYWLIKILPFWGLSLLGVFCIYLGPLTYMTNQELIDHHLRNASDAMNTQTNQIKELAGQHTARASETVKAYAGDYTAKAQEYIGNARGRSTSPEVSSPKSSANAPVKSEPGSAPNYSPSDFPHAPKQEPTPGVTSHQEQYENSQFGGQAVPAS